MKFRFPFSILFRLLELKFLLTFCGQARVAACKTAIYRLGKTNLWKRIFLARKIKAIALDRC
jgi:hypothetical protein